MSDYWDLDDFLSESQNLSITFMQNCKCLSFLDQGAGSENADIKKSSKLDVPLHLALNLGRV